MYTVRNCTREGIMRWPRLFKREGNQLLSQTPRIKTIKQFGNEYHVRIGNKELIIISTPSDGAYFNDPRHLV